MLKTVKIKYHSPAWAHFLFCSCFWKHLRQTIGNSYWTTNGPPVLTYIYHKGQNIQFLHKHIHSVCHSTADFRPIFHSMQYVCSWWAGRGLDPLSSVYWCALQKVDKWLLMETVNGRLFTRCSLKWPREHCIKWELHITAYRLQPCKHW